MSDRSDLNSSSSKRNASNNLLLFFLITSLHELVKRKVAPRASDHANTASFGLARADLVGSGATLSPFKAIEIQSKATAYTNFP